MLKETETEETLGFLLIFPSLRAFKFRGPAPPGLRLWVSSPKVVWTGLTERFSNFQSRDIGIIGPENHHKLWRERGRFKKIRQKIFHSIIYL